MLLNRLEDTFDNSRGSLLTTWRKTGPIIIVDDADRSVGIHYAISPINFYPHDMGGLFADGMKSLCIKRNPLRLSIDSLVTIFAVAFIVRIEPEEERLTGNAVEFTRSPVRWRLMTARVIPR